MNTPKEALIITAAGLAVTAFFGYGIVRALRSRGWRPVEGTVLEKGVEEVAGDSTDGGSKRRLRVWVRYQYTVGGDTFTGDRLSFFDMAFRHSSSTLAQAHLQAICRGNAIHLWVDTADPAQAVNDRAIPLGYWFAVALGLIFVAGGALPLLLGRLKG